MRRTMPRGSWLGLALLFFARGARAEEVVGLRDPHSQFFVAVRGIIPEGAVVRGIQFYSNDATTFPEVALAADIEDRRLPGVGNVLQSVANVVASPGYTVVALAPHQVPTNAYLWAVLRFPSNAGLRAPGLGGGPGIGWRDAPALERERSFFSVDGALNEFRPAFDITILTSSPIPHGSKSSPSEPAPTPGLWVTAHERERGGNTTFALRLPAAARVVIDLYTIAGGRLLRLHDGVLQAGSHEVLWPGVDAHGQEAASGIYLYEVKVGAERRTGKVVLLK